MTDRDDRLARALLKQEIEDFLYREADLLDERRYDEWLGLLAEDVRYWMPMRRNVKVDDLEREFTREGRDISWFDEGKDTLTRRVRQIETDILVGKREDLLRRAGTDWQIARRKILLDQNVLLSKNLTFFF